ncbi:FecCD family ABC transporter permease [Chordicoccus furentiruminis]|uniref:FecCD family ABC transporter permease n=1 Tax=Chordicoccus furentiruminis TaxID=2709410 RepID=UPI0023A809F8|nr:iron ABC transporter permease [Chordicoccus furentiruminis]
MTFAGLAVLLAVMMVLSIGIGTVSIPPAGVLQALTGRGGSEEVRNIVMTLRLPRTLMAAVLGGALSVSGCLLQTFFANPIAGPFILGISSGAKMAVAATMILIIGSTGRSSNLMIVAAAFAGALISTSFIILVSKKVRHIGSLLAAGIMIGYICSAVTDLMVTFAEDQDIVNLHSWSQGSFSGVTWDGVAFASVLVAVVFACTMLLSKPIGAFQMGEHYARSMGVNVERCRVMLILLSSLLSACVTAFAGPISFVGIAVPFLVKGLMRTARPVVVLPGAFLGGAVFCVFADLLARTMLAPTELNISTVTSIFGAPIVIFMLIRSQENKRM